MRPTTTTTHEPSVPRQYEKPHDSCFRTAAEAELCACHTSAFSEPWRSATMLQAGCEPATASNKPQNWRAISISWCPVFLLVLPRLRIVVSSSSTSSSSSSRLVSACHQFLSTSRRSSRVEFPYLPPPSSLVDSEVHGLALCLIWRSKCSTWCGLPTQRERERERKRERGVVVLSQATLQIARMHQVLPKCAHRTKFLIHTGGWLAAPENIQQFKCVPNFVGLISLNIIKYLRIITYLSFSS